MFEYIIEFVNILNYKIDGYIFKIHISNTKRLYTI